MQPQTRYAAARGARIAYQVTGRGPDLVMIPGMMTHLELLWRLPAYRRFVPALLGRLTAAEAVADATYPPGGSRGRAPGWDRPPRGVVVPAYLPGRSMASVKMSSSGAAVVATWPAGATLRVSDQIGCAVLPTSTRPL